MSGKNNKSIRILYVEDEKDLRVLYALMLEMLGYEVRCANNGQLGVEKAASWNPDIILMDLRMPVMSGPEAVRLLRSKPETARVPVFILSAFTDGRTRDTCHQAGADRFFTKPPDIDKLDATIREFLRQSSH